MNISRRSLIKLAGLGAGACVLAGCASEKPTAEEPKDYSTLRFVTGGEVGTYYAFGSVLAQHATANTNIEVTALTSGGSQANVTEIQDGNAELGFCQSDIMYYAYEGINLFEEIGRVDNIKTVASLYNEQVQCVTCNSEIKSFADLKGKTVSLGDAGSGVYFNALDILKSYGIEEEDITVTQQGNADAAQSLNDDQIDAAFFVACAPAPAIVDLSLGKDIYLLSLDAEHARILGQNDFYSTDTIPAGTYKGQKKDVLAAAVSAVIVADEGIDEDVIYEFTKDIFAGCKDNADAHAKYADISIERGASITGVPYHTGAAKFYGENGIRVRV